MPSPSPPLPNRVRQKEHLVAHEKEWGKEDTKARGSVAVQAGLKRGVLQGIRESYGEGPSRRSQGIVLRSHNPKSSLSSLSRHELNWPVAGPFTLQSPPDRMLSQLSLHKCAFKLEN